MSLITYATIAVLLIALFSQMFKILREYERGVIFLLGRFQRVKGPGLIILIPGIQKIVRVDLRVLVLEFLPWRGARKHWIGWGAGFAFAAGLLFVIGVI